MEKIKLTLREREVLELLAKGSDIVMISQQLKISESTVNSYRTRINYKLTGAGLQEKTFKRKLSYLVGKASACMKTCANAQQCFKIIFSEKCNFRLH